MYDKNKIVIIDMYMMNIYDKNEIAVMNILQFTKKLDSSTFCLYGLVLYPFIII